MLLVLIAALALMLGIALEERRRRIFAEERLEIVMERWDRSMRAPGGSL